MKEEALAAIKRRLSELRQGWTRATFDDDGNKKMHPVDVHVGSRIRLFRGLAGLSQSEMGSLLGLTFQQVQKYESGANRISGSKIFELSVILEVPLSAFFDGLESGQQVSPDFTQSALDPRHAVSLLKVREEQPEVFAKLMAVANAANKSHGSEPQADTPDNDL